KTFASFPPKEQEALLEHCVKHLLHLHPSRRKEKNRHDWDIATDLAINPGIDSIPAHAPQPEFFGLPVGLSAEEYYNLLVPPFSIGNLEGAGAGDNPDDDGQKQEKSSDFDTSHADVSPIDNHDIWGEADSIPVRLAEEMVRNVVQDAMDKADNKAPPELVPLIDSLLATPEIPWQTILRQFVATAGRIGRKSSWQRENRRFSHNMPGSIKRHRLNLLVGIDISDSTNKPELREAFAKELLHIAKSRDSVLTVLYANSRIKKIENLKGEMVTAEVYQGGGFTDLRPVFEYAKTMQKPPSAIIYITDGIGPAPEKMEFPTLWVLTEDGEKPVNWGVELRLV
ncbi:MAG: VWA-like domain-containing protein, partial [Desulfuromonadales bacterium]|nr:VWA-like domain-containing protein [Desulfuromonadales bacterium]